MRQDMKKVLCERPRVGHAMRSSKTAKKLNPHWDWSSDEHDWGPTRASSARTKQARNGHLHKYLTDYLTPLVGYLDRNVGRVWDDVYSEIRSAVDHRSTPGNHLIDHVRWEVQQGVVMVDGEPYNYHARWRRNDRPYVGLYVHPDTGMLCRSESTRKPKPVKPVEAIQWRDNVWFRFEKHKKAIDGCRDFEVPEDPERGMEPVCKHGLLPEEYAAWYVVDYGWHDPEEVLQVIEYDTATERQRWLYGLGNPGDSVTIRYKDRPSLLNEPFVIRKRQANRRELKYIRDTTGGGKSRP